jgi:hypothetical protein
VTLAFAAVRFARIADGEFTFLAVLLGIFTVLLVFNVVDLLVLDWLIFVTIRPEIVVLPAPKTRRATVITSSTSRAFLKGVVGSFAASFVTAAVAQAAKASRPDRAPGSTLQV